ncbi:Helix-turn-helix domain-containing protein [Sphingobacterium nematocida]|uniref:Helix-turn-helix domain-containing protein n=1 Tax=Sphingobacterium nematocida TaxID=1513896 RepID=A0A1T5F4W1_9SPHI|nr:helix-turn-helix domain-containing protein [Sphingobacterium nematocida]SKB91176.1 Helix-turn-helix domain-containing protein [Sphingobacterium nematocida]
MGNSNNSNGYQETFRLNHNYYFDNFANGKKFFESTQRWLDDTYFLIFFGSSNNTHREQHVLLFFNLQYSHLQEMSAPLKEGVCFAIRSDLFKEYSRRNRLRDFGFLEYSIQESIILMDSDYGLIKNIFELIHQETKAPASDIQSSILVAYLNLLLRHMQRFYLRSMEDRVNELRLLYQDFINDLQSLFDTERKSMIILPSLALLAKKLSCTPRFLNDVSLKISENTAQRHIDNFIVKRTKELLAETDLSVAEIAEKMKFNQPQSLTRLFKRITRISPLDYRISII